MKNSNKKLTSGRLQDIEATLEIIKKSGKTARFIYKIGIVPYLMVKHNITDEQWIAMLEFERKQEIERLKFYRKLLK